MCQVFMVQVSCQSSEWLELDPRVNVIKIVFNYQLSIFNFQLSILEKAYLDDAW